MTVIGTQARTRTSDFVMMEMWLTTRWGTLGMISADDVSSVIEYATSNGYYVRAVQS